MSPIAHLSVEETQGEATGPAFISRQDLTDYLGRDVTADAGALIAVNAACSVVCTVAEQAFAQVTGDVIWLDGTGTDCLLLPELPATGAGTVVVNGGTVTDYRLADNGRLIRTSGTLEYATLAGSIDVFPVAWPHQTHVWPLGRENVVVTYDHGYAGTVPSDIRMVALSLAARIVVQGVATEEAIGDVSVKYAGPAMDLSANELRILRKYRPTR